MLPIWLYASVSAVAPLTCAWASNGSPRDVRADANDRFCLDGSQLKSVGGSQYSTEIETFARITAQGSAGAGPAYFIVERKDGLIYEYGNSTNARIEFVGSSTVRTWAVNKIRDRSGNAILFSYTEDLSNGAYRIDTVQYTANPLQGISAPYEVKFEYEALPASEVDMRFMAGAVMKRITRLDRVEVKHSGSLVRRYELSFEAALSSTVRSRLASIQECAGAPLDCLAATTFQYQNGTVGVSNAYTPGFSTVTTASYPIDVNGDGRSDLVYPSAAPPSGVWLIRLANPDGSYGSAINSGIASNNAGLAQPIDYNADGREDLLVPHSGGTWWVLQGTSSGLASPFNTGIPADGANGNVRILDVNGDGLDDLVWADLSGADNHSLKYRLRVLSGTFSASAFLLGPVGLNTTISDPAFSVSPFRSRDRHPDVNGDGRDDLVVRVQQFDPELSITYSFWVLVLGGMTNTLDNAYPIPSSGFYSFPRFADMNGDGLSDLFYAVGNNWRFMFSRGGVLGPEQTGPARGTADLATAVVLDWDSDGFKDIVLRNSDGALLLMRSTGEALQPYVSTGQTLAAGSLYAGEVNGDGLDDLLHIAFAGTTYSHYVHAGAVPDLLDRATDGFGNYADFDYATLSSSGACYIRSSPEPTYPERAFRDPLPVVCSASSNNGIGGAYTVSYQYYNANLNLQGRGFEGFGARLSQDSRNGLYAYEYFNLTFPYTGTLYQRDLVQTNNVTLISRVVNNWGAYSYGSGVETRKRPYVSSSSNQDYEVGGTFNGVLIRSSATTNTVDSSTGTVTDTTTTVTEGNNANGLNAGASYTFRTYVPSLFNDTANWCFGRPTRTQQINSHSLFGGAAQTRTVDTSWDGVYCRPTDGVVEPGNATRQVTTALTYDNFGNPATQTVTPIGQAARLTQFNWGSDGHFPRTITNALSQATTLDWWSALGQLRSITDSNGLSRTSNYDAFGRVTSEVAPDSTSTLIEYLPCDVECNAFANTRYKIRTTLRDSAAGTIAERFAYFDGFDRARRRASYSLEGGPIDQLTEYDALGRVARSSTPYFRFTASPVWTSYTYDVLSRQRQASRDRTSDADSSASTSTFDFNGLTITSTDPQGKVRVDTLDPLGQILRAVQASGTVDQSTVSYDYDAFANLVRTTDGSGNQILIGYDVRGFKISSNDPDLGNWTYDYFPTGELKRQTDAKSQVTDFTYDKLSRPLMRVEPADSGSGTQTTTWTWGTSAAAFNIGQLQSITVGSYSETYSYDNRSRLSSTTVGANGGSYVLSQSYNATTGLLESITYPISTGAAPFKVKYEYETGNKSGLLQRVKDYNAGTVFWQAVSSNALGQYQDVTLGNGLKTLTAFDSITGAINRIDTGLSGGNALQYLQYAWDKVGNLTSRQDLNISKSETFSYDNLYRLTQAQVSGATALTLAYNQIGNITSKSDLGSYSYHPTKKHAVTSAGPVTITYDANGNVETQTSLATTATVNWTAYNLPKLISTNTGRSSQFLYGADRQRYKHVSVASGVTETTIYVKGIFEKVTRPTGTEYRHLIQGPSGVIAVHNRKSSGTNETSYILKDHLGSTDVITNAAGASLVKLSFSALGARRKGSTWIGSPTSADQTAIASTSRLGFTEHEQIDHLDLVHMNGRVYQPLLGRFISADPFVQAPFNSQSLNRYSYVFNNPLSFTDPSGFVCVERSVGGASRLKPPSPLGNGEDGGCSEGGRLSGPGFGDGRGDVGPGDGGGRPEDTRLPMPDRPQPTGVDKTPANVSNVTGARSNSWMTGSVNGRLAGFAATLALPRAAAGTFRLLTLGGPQLTFLVAGVFLPENLFFNRAKESDFSSGGYPVFNEKPTVPPGQALDVLSGQSPNPCPDPENCNDIGNTDNIVLGFQGNELESTARAVGGRTLMNIRGDFRPVFIELVNNPGVRFTIRLDGLAGANTREQLLNAINRGIAQGSDGGFFNYELATLSRAGRLGEATLLRGGKPVPNPFGAP